MSDDQTSSVHLPRAAAWAGVVALGVGPFGSAALVSPDVERVSQALLDVRVSVESLRSDVRALSIAQDRYAEEIAIERKERRDLEERVRRLETARK